MDSSEGWGARSPQASLKGALVPGQDSEALGEPQGGSAWPGDGRRLVRKAGGITFTGAARQHHFRGDIINSKKIRWGTRWKGKEGENVFPPPRGETVTDSSTTGLKKLSPLFLFSFFWGVGGRGLCLLCSFHLPQRSQTSQTLRRQGRGRCPREPRLQPSSATP